MLRSWEQGWCRGSKEASNEAETRSRGVKPSSEADTRPRGRQALERGGRCAVQRPALERGGGSLEGCRGLAISMGRWGFLGRGPQHARCDLRFVGLLVRFRYFSKKGRFPPLLGDPCGCPRQ